MNRLGEYVEFVTLGSSLIEKIRSCGLTGEKKNLAFGQFASRDDSCFDSAHTRHDDVTYQKIGLKMFNLRDRFFPTKPRNCFKPCLIENDRKSIRYQYLVVNDDDSSFYRLRHGVPLLHAMSGQAIFVARNTHGSALSRLKQPNLSEVASWTDNELSGVELPLGSRSHDNHSNSSH
jgi:hypothetical protein